MVTDRTKRESQTNFVEENVQKRSLSKNHGGMDRSQIKKSDKLYMHQTQWVMNSEEATLVKNSSHTAATR